MRTAFLSCHLLGIIFLMSPNSCQPEYRDNSRIFVEGKIISQNPANLPMKLYAGTILITETTSSLDGSFKLGGPGTTGEKELSFNKKITSFSSNENGCKLSYDSLSIYLPVDKSYFNFAQISLKQ